jgi:Peptidase family C25
VWASSGFTDAQPQAFLNQALLAKLAQNPSQPLGNAILAAKSAVTDADVRRTWILFGDPSMRLQFPAQPPTHHTRPGRVTVTEDHLQVPRGRTNAISPR